MTSVARRAGSKLAELIERASDPGATLNRIKLYAKEAAGETQLFAQDSAGTVHQLTPSSSLSSEFIFASMSGNQTFGVGTVIDFDTDGGSNVLSVNSSGRFSGLGVGNAYYIFAAIRVDGLTNPTTVDFRWHDVTAAADIGRDGKAPSDTAAANDTNQSNAVAIIVPAVSTQVECRMLAGAAAGSLVLSATSFAYIHQLSPI